MLTTMATDLFAGPVNHVAFVLPRDADLGSVAQSLAANIASGAVEVLDLEFVALGADGVAAPVTATDDPRLADFDTARTDLLDAEDIAALGAEITAGDYAVVVVYEDRVLAPVAARVHDLGGRELWSGGVTLDDLEAALVGKEEDR